MISEKTLHGKFLYYMLAILFCLYGLSEYVDILIILVFIALSLVKIGNEEIDYLYFAMIFFEPVLMLPFVGYSLFRIFQPLFLLYIIIKNKTKLHFSALPIAAAAMMIAVPILSRNGISGLISMAVNVLIVVYISLKNKEPFYYKKMCYIISLFAAAAGVYGLFRGRVMYFGLFTRLSGTINDPNYSALFFIFGIIALVGCREIISRRELAFLLIVLLASLMLTVSMSGIIVMTGLVFLYAFIKSKSKFCLYILAFLSGLYLLIVTPLPYSNPLFPIQYRIMGMLQSNAASVTSGRTDIWRNYISIFKNLSVKEKLIGGNDTVAGAFRDGIVGQVGTVSHQSIIDMLYMVGILGTIAILIIFVVSIIHNYKLYTHTKADIYLTLMLLKIAVILMGMTISIFPFRYFMTFFILQFLEEKNENTLALQHHAAKNSSKYIKNNR